MIAAAGGAYALVTGVVTLLGYALNVPRLADWNGDDIAMFPNTAACAAFCGALLLLLAVADDRGPRSAAARIAVRLIAGTVALVGGLTMLEHLAGVNLGIDTLLGQRPWGQRAATAPMRMGPPASTSYVIIGIAFILATYGAHARRVAAGLSILALAIASLPLVGYWFGADRLFGVARFTGIAFQTSAALVAITIGLMASLPDVGLAAMLRRDDSGGVIVRRLLLPIIAIPLALGWLLVRGQEAGYFDTAFGTAVLVLAMIAVLLALTWRTARGVSGQARLTRAAEQSIRDSEARHRALLDVAVHGVLTIDENGVIESANPAAERLFGYPAAELIGRNIAVLMPEPYRGRHDSYLENYRRTGVRKVIGLGREVVGRRKDGSEFPMDLAVSEFRLGPKRYFTGIVVDITDRKHAEGALRESEARLREELDRRAADLAALHKQIRRTEAMAMVGSFAGGIAHDLGNLLLPMRLHLEALRRGELAPDLRENALAVEKSVRYVGELATRLRRAMSDLAREGEITHAAAEPLDAARWCRDAEPFLRSIVPAPFSLSLDVPSGLPLIRVDRIGLTQAVYNLIQNAVKAMRGSGVGTTIRLRAGERRESAQLWLVVEDDGPGMTAEVRRRCLEAYFSTGSPADGALGLGLTLVKAFADASHGAIEVVSPPPESTVPRGTAVYVRFPAHTPEIVVPEPNWPRRERCRPGSPPAKKA